MQKKIYFGLAQWRHSQWYYKQSSVSSFEVYSQSFSTVEGNSSFYALPSEQNLYSWHRAANKDFRFCFKFPKEISHKLNLSHCSRQVSEFLNRVSVLNENLGVLWLQLDQYCHGGHLAKIINFLDQLPSDFNYGVEVRHLDFFSKGEIEKRFNQYLIRKHINRVMFDTRSLFSLKKEMELGLLQASDLDKATLEAFDAKPRVPAHILATGQHPFVRVIIPMDINLGMLVIKQWVTKINQWLSEGLVPYVFFHTPDNARAPEFAVEFTKQLSALNNGIDIISLWQDDIQQDALF